MGLVDKVKHQATQVASKAQEAGKAGQAKVEALQARRKAEGLLQELGAIAYRARTDRARTDDEQRAVDLVGRLRQHEAEHGSLDEPSDGAAGATESA